jgi:hypothetical protein
MKGMWSVFACNKTPAVEEVLCLAIARLGMRQTKPIIRAGKNFVPLIAYLYMGNLLSLFHT